jgi:hypothetical protein
VNQEAAGNSTTLIIKYACNYLYLTCVLAMFSYCKPHSSQHLSAFLIILLLSTVCVKKDPWIWSECENIVTQSFYIIKKGEAKLSQYSMNC